jgi:hypothetical protein
MIGGESMIDWRERFMDQLPYRDCEIINLPPKFD